MNNSQVPANLKNSVARLDSYNSQKINSHLQTHSNVFNLPSANNSANFSRKFCGFKLWFLYLNFIFKVTNVSRKI